MARKARPAPEPYEVNDAARTIKRAHDHMADKHMMKHVKKHVRGEAKNMAAFAKALQGGQALGGGAAQPAAPQPGGGMMAFGP